MVWSGVKKVVCSPGAFRQAPTCSIDGQSTTARLWVFAGARRVSKTPDRRVEAEFVNGECRLDDSTLACGETAFTRE